jgi:hypothetical protein
MAWIAWSRYSLLRFEGLFQGAGQYLAYKAVNSAGKLGCEYTFIQLLTH